MPHKNELHGRFRIREEFLVQREFIFLPFHPIIEGSLLKQLFS
jgi:hypothetical protein